MPPLQHNARLVAVSDATAATAGRDDFFENEGTEPTGAGASKWTGDIAVYYREAIDDKTGDVLVRRSLWLTTVDARKIGIDTDDVVTFVGPDGVQRKATAKLVAYSDAQGSYQTGEVPSGRIVSSQIETTRLELTPA